ncbi:hypothetical protein LEN26_008049 [Aphanomyces euteiches]|nr:hypothetical protein AeMF1_003646 [Aphanomyces euteiches]KAH9130960.1 hypothetical protein LEN26_008049 [Aphanomyces euteiches]KAH9191212.1 hypothetical protein AeNC1_006806 [Aphanomyces euteiches]
MMRMLRVAAVHPRRSLFVGQQWRHASSALRVLFFGTDNISLATLKRLHANMSSKSSEPPLIKDIEIVCPPDKRMARARQRAPVPVKQFALEHNLTVHHIPDDVKSLKDWPMPTQASFDVGVVVSFGYFIHPHMLEHVKHGAINMHPSLLPKYRGPAPIPRALFNGDTKTGISVIEIDPTAFDVGRILLQKEVPIAQDATYHSLSADLAGRGAACVIDTLKDLEAKKKLAVAQDNAKASKAPKMKREHGIVQWTESTAQLYNMWRAVGETFGVMASFAGKSVKLIHMHVPTNDQVAAFEAHLVDISPATLQAGACLYDKATKALWVRATDGWLVVTQLQVADRKIGQADEFANGHRLKPRHLYAFDQQHNKIVH